LNRTLIKLLLGVLALGIDTDQLLDFGRGRTRSKPLGSAELSADLLKRLPRAEKLKSVPGHVILDQRVHIYTKTDSFRFQILDVRSTRVTSHQADKLGQGLAILNSIIQFNTSVQGFDTLISYRICASITALVRHLHCSLIILEYGNKSTIIFKYL